MISHERKQHLESFVTNLVKSVKFFSRVIRIAFLDIIGVRMTNVLLDLEENVGLVDDEERTLNPIRSRTSQQRQWHTEYKRSLSLSLSLFFADDSGHDIVVSCIWVVMRAR